VLVLLGRPGLTSEGEASSGVLFIDFRKKGIPVQDFKLLLPAQVAQEIGKSLEKKRKKEK
jgi:hypothetical protein